MTGPRRSGWRWIRPVVAGHKAALARLAVWSVLAALPALLSGQLLALAMDHGFLAGNAAFGLACLSCFAVAMVVGALASRQAIRPAADVVEAVRDHVMSDTVRGSLHDAVATGRVPGTKAVSRITSQTESVRTLLSGLLLTVGSVGFTMTAAIAGVFSLSPVVGLLTLPIVLLAGGALAWVSKLWRRRYERYLTEEEALSDEAGSMLGGLRDVLACGSPDQVGADLDDRARTVAGATTATATMGAIRVVVVGVAARVPLVVLLVAAPWLVSIEALTVGELVGAATYLMFGLEPALRTLVETIGNMGLELAALLGRLAAHSRVRPTTSRATMTTPRYGISLHGVTFRYGEHSAPVLDQASLDIPEDRHLAVVGPSGIGKSTLASVLAGLETPERGVVRLGGLALSQAQPEWLRRHVALIPQEAYVFAGTVAENLTYLSGPVDRGVLDHAVRVVGACSLVRHLGGYDASVDSPDTLSPGQRQLLALVRVYLSPARVVILDEATCHVDSATEEQVEQAFAARGGTLIVIAHRLSSALRAQRVLVLDGAGMRLGTHHELLRESGKYADMFGHWTAGSPVAR